MLHATIIKSCDGDVNDLFLSRSTLFRSQKTNYVKIAESALNKFAMKRLECMALHWDDKLRTNQLGNRLEALAVIVSSAPCYKNGKMLGIQKITNASGNA